MQFLTRAAVAKLPGDLWKPLVDVLDRQLPASDVRLAVQKMHTDVYEYLKGSAGRAVDEFHDRHAAGVVSQHVCHRLGR